MRSSTWAALTAIVMSCQREAPPPPPPIDPATITWPAPKDAGPKPEYRHDPPINPLDETVAGKGKTFMVSSESEDATKVGKAILAGGGNAVDAAVATAFALAVTHPSAGNLGGGGFAIVRVAAGKAVALDFREVAPGAATATMYLDNQGKVTDQSVLGHKASGVPGAVAGLHALHAKLGKKPWKEVVQPAIDLARDGFKIDTVLGKSLAHERISKKLKKYGASKAIWFDGDKTKPAGTVVKIPELAGHARAHPRSRPRRVLQRGDREGDRRRHEAGRRHHHRRRPREVQGRVARAAAVRVSRQVGGVDASAVVGRHRDGDDRGDPRELRFLEGHVARHRAHPPARRGLEAGVLGTQRDARGIPRSRRTCRRPSRG